MHEENEEIQDYYEMLEKILREETVQCSPVIKFFEISTFISYSKGRGRIRKTPKTVVLLKPRGEERYVSWNPENDDPRIPFDEFAADIYKDSNRRNPSDKLREELREIIYNKNIY